MQYGRSRLGAVQVCLLKIHRDGLYLCLYSYSPHKVRHRQRSPSEQKLSDYKMSEYKNLKGFYNPKGNVKCKRVLGREKKQTVRSQCNLSCHPSEN